MDKKLSFDDARDYANYRTLCKVPKDILKAQAQNYIEQQKRVADAAKKKHEVSQETITEQQDAPVSQGDTKDQQGKSEATPQKPVISREMAEDKPEISLKNKPAGGFSGKALLGVAVFGIVLAGIGGYVLGGAGNNNAEYSQQGNSSNTVSSADQQNGAAAEGMWRDNVLRLTYTENTADDVYVNVGNSSIKKPGVDYLVDSTIQKKDIQTITFLDSLENAPEDSWNVSDKIDGQVFAWTEENGSYYDLYIAAEGGINLKNCASLFAEYVSVETIDFNDCVYTSDAVNMAYMFSSCYDLKEIDVSNFDTSNVSNMSHMFAYCSSLTSLDLGGFDTSNVSEMDSMFSSCESLEVVEVSNFDTANVTDMNRMFLNCKSLIQLDISNFVTDNVTDMQLMFCSCESLPELDVSNFATGNVTNMSGMFESCESLEKVDVSSFDKANVTTMMNMFLGCSNLSENSKHEIEEFLGYTFGAY